MRPIRYLCLFLMACTVGGCAGIQSGQYIRVQQGETLEKIAQQFSIPPQRIKDFNPQVSLRPGELLFIPLERGILSQNIAPGRWPSSVSPGAGQLLWPVPASKKISSHFGPRWGRNHYGIDIKAAEGSAIQSVDGGKVIYSGRKLRGFGNMIVIRHPLGIYTLYAHNQVNYVRVGQWVSRGQLIGRVGRTGRSTGSHLHFEVRQGDKAVNPLTFYPQLNSRAIAQSSHRH